jgi:predicted nuclease of predicted toxin-antitoxin system
MARLYTNENFPLQVVNLLRTLGHDVLTVQEAGNAGQAIPDEEVLAFAVQHNRAVVTLNRRDFMRLHRANASHFGIIVCTQDEDVVGQAKRIDQAINDANNLSGRIIRVNRPP